MVKVMQPEMVKGSHLGRALVLEKAWHLAKALV
jgi:hypothetical protein